jgi:hypothetical protein
LSGVPTAFFQLLLLGWAFIALPAFAVVERRVERRFEVSSESALKVDAMGGDVRITSDPTISAIEISVIQRAEVDTEEEMDQRLRALSLTMTQRKGTVMVTGLYSRSVTFSWTTWPPVNLIYEIKVPRRCDVDVYTHAGGIVIGELEGRVNVENESGNIFLGEIDGPVTAQSNSGHVGVTAATGPIFVSTVTGNITVGRAGGRTRLSSQGGYMELQRARGEVVIRGSGSDASVGFVSPMEHSADIKTSGGEIVLVLETTSACSLDVRSSLFGKVGLRGELPLKVVAGGVGETRLSAHVNGGGPRISARAHGGNVVVRGVAPLPVAMTDRRSGVGTP